MKSGSSFLAPVSIIITCYNEEDFIEDRIEAFLKKENWIADSEIIIVTGGSTDSTEEILKKYEFHEAVKPLIFDRRILKIEGVNIGVKESKNEFLVFSDCRQEIEPSSVPSLINHFSDAEIGLVNSTLIDSKNASSPSFLRSLLNYLAIRLSVNSSSLNVFGALYAQRKACFREIPNDVLFDDLFVTASMLAQKKRLVQDKNAIIYDMNFTMYYQKERIMRLARGLLLFLVNHFSDIQAIPVGDRMRFLIFKYVKLMLPFAALLFLCSLLGMFIFGQYIFPVVVISLIVLLLIIPFSRKTTRQLMEIHYYFGIAVIQFALGKNRSITWDKLKNVK